MGDLTDRWNAKMDYDLAHYPGPGGDAPQATPAARWHAEGKPDPHGSRYDCERAALCGGHMTDDELANQVFLYPTMANLTAAKDRIRWLSRALAKATNG